MISFLSSFLSFLLLLLSSSSFSSCLRLTVRAPGPFNSTNFNSIGAALGSPLRDYWRTGGWSAGDEVVIWPGIYREQFNFGGRGNSTFPFTVRAAGEEEGIFEGKVQIRGSDIFRGWTTENRQIIYPKRMATTDRGVEEIQNSLNETCRIWTNQVNYTTRYSDSPAVWYVQLTDYNRRSDNVFVFDQRLRQHTDIQEISLWGFHIENDFNNQTQMKPFRPRIMTLCLPLTINLTLFPDAVEISVRQAGVNIDYVFYPSVPSVAVKMKDLIIERFASIFSSVWPDSTGAALNFRSGSNHTLENIIVRDNSW